MKKNGFTLIELMVVITLIMLLAGLTGADYLKFRDRLQLEGAAKNIASTFELANKYARTGNRGDGVNCSVEAVGQDDILSQEKPLLYWGVKSADGGKAIQMYICCAKKYSDCNVAGNYDEFDKIQLPKNIKIVETPPHGTFDYKFRSLWGGVMKIDPMTGNDTGLDSPQSIHTQAFGDDGDNKSNYYFLLGQEGWTTDGCFKDGLKLIDYPEKGCL